MEGITDLHTHIIPAADDGSQNMSITLQILEHESRQGVNHVFATSHSIAYIDEIDASNTLESYQLLKECIRQRNLPLHLYLGCEIFCTYGWMERILHYLENGQFPSMNGSRYVLIEFSSLHASLDEVLFCSEQLLEHGRIPIYAHIERYFYSFASVEFISMQREKGCLFQMNYESLCDEEDTGISEFARILLRNELVDFMGSDTHNMHHRPPRIENGLKYIEYNTSEEYRSQLLYGNVKRYLMEDSTELSL